MRTLKKSLCLVLALVFVLGLCTFGTNAAYAGYSDIAKVTTEYMDAVEVLSGLEVIEGYPDGTFVPGGDVTRAEAAAMIARMMLGRKEADKLPIGDVKFSDVPETNWAAKYIAFCANKGIIVGMGDNTFHPNDNVTGTQMATMLLRALGYGVIGEYEGKGWDINAVADALYYGIFEDSKVTDFNQPATREETALYVWNTMLTEIVGYDVDRNYYDPQGKYFAKEAFGLDWIEYSQVLANQKTGEDYTVVKDYERVRVWDDEEEEYVYVNVMVPKYLNYETDLDLIGHEVTVYYKADTPKEDKVNHLTYFETYLIKDESKTIIAGRDYMSFDDLYRALKGASKLNVGKDLRDVPMWMNYDYESDLHVSGIMDYDSGASFHTIEGAKDQKSTFDSMYWIFIFSKTWILDHKGELMLVLDTSRDIGKVKSVDASYDEVEVKVWRGSEYYYLPEYERYEADVYIPGFDEPVAKKGDPVFDPDTYTYVTKKDADGNDIINTDYPVLYAKDYYYVDEEGDAYVNPETGRPYESLTQFGEEGVTYYRYGDSKITLYKTVDTDHFETEFYDMSKDDIKLVYDGIAKDDYVVVQPVGKLTYIQPTTIEELEITDRTVDAFGSWTFNEDYGEDEDYGIPIDDTDDPARVGVGDLVKFYVAPTTFGVAYFGLQVLESANTVGYVYLNYATVVEEHTDWGKEKLIKVQLIDENGEELAYPMTVKAYKDAGLGGLTTTGTGDDEVPVEINFDEVKTGLYSATVRKGYVYLEKPKEQVEFDKVVGRNSYLAGTYDNYFVNSDTKVIYFTDKAGDLEITVTNKLADRDGETGSYKVYAVSKTSGGSYKLNVIWVNKDAPAVYGDNIMFIMGSRDGASRSPAGYNTKDDKDTPYYNVYIDGASTKVYLTGDKSIYESETSVNVKRGFYRFSYDAEKDIYELFKVPTQYAANAKCVEQVVLTKNGTYTVKYDSKSGAYRYYAPGSDGINLSCTIKDISGATTKGTKRDTAINDYERLVELLNLGYKVTVNYMFVKSDDTQVPVGVMYVTAVDSKSATD